MHTVEMLERMMEAAERAGYTVRLEWLGGAGGGACEFGGRKWIFVDLALSVVEQLDQVAAALRGRSGGVGTDEPRQPCGSTWASPGGLTSPAGDADILSSDNSSPTAVASGPCAASSDLSLPSSAIRQSFARPLPKEISTPIRRTASRAAARTIDIAHCDGGGAMPAGPEQAIFIIWDRASLGNEFPERSRWPCTTTAAGRRPSAKTFCCTTPICLRKYAAGLHASWNPEWRASASQADIGAALGAGSCSVLEDQADRPAAAAVDQNAAGRPAGALSLALSRPSAPDHHSRRPLARRIGRAQLRLDLSESDRPVGPRSAARSWNSIATSAAATAATSSSATKTW